MKKIDLNDVEEILYKRIGEVSLVMDPEVKKSIEKYRVKESNSLAKNMLDDILDNADMAKKFQKPLCQDTGIAVFFVEIGSEISFNGSFEKMLYRVTERAYKDFYLRKSMVIDPLFGRKNTQTNLPPLINYRYTDGDILKISFAAKGGGSENMSKLAMLKPADGVEGVKKFVIDSVVNAKGNPCPPVIVGVGVGGNFENCAILAKKALFRDLNDSHIDENWSQMEKDILVEINKRGYGVQGVGGDTTALAVKIEYLPCHIASLPVAVNIQCHSHRHFSVLF